MLRCYIYRVKVLLLLTIALLLGASTTAQSTPPSVVDLASESHHAIVLENEHVRVFRLSLKPGEATAPHRHKGFYLYFTLHPLTISNEVRGREPVLTELAAGEIRTSKGGFTLSERNQSSGSAELLVVEPITVTSDGFTSPMASFRYHDAAFGEIFESQSVRGYEMTIAAGGRTEPHPENYDRLIIALTDFKLTDTPSVGPQSIQEMHAGEVRWFLRGSTHAITNSGTSIAKFITLEFS